MVQRDLDLQQPPGRVCQMGNPARSTRDLGGFQASSQAPSALQSIVRLAGGIASGSHRDQLKLVGIVEVKRK